MKVTETSRKVTETSRRKVAENCKNVTETAEKVTETLSKEGSIGSLPHPDTSDDIYVRIFFWRFSSVAIFGDLSQVWLLLTPICYQNFLLATFESLAKNWF